MYVIEFALSACEQVLLSLPCLLRRVKYENIMELEKSHLLAEQAALIDGLKQEVQELTDKLEAEQNGRKVSICYQHLVNDTESWDANRSLPIWDTNMRTTPCHQRFAHVAAGVGGRDEASFHERSARSLMS